MIELLLALGVALAIALAAFFYYLSKALTSRQRNRLTCCVVRAHGDEGSYDKLPDDTVVDCDPTLTDQRCIGILNDAGIALGKLKPKGTATG